MLDQDDRDPLTGQIIGAAIDVHRELGPGLLESIYEECLAVELADRGLLVVRQAPVPVVFKGRTLACGYRLDMLVNDAVILEIKCVERILAVHEAQLLTYLRLTRKKCGLILNFHTAQLRNGIVRRVL